MNMRITVFLAFILVSGCVTKGLMLEPPGDRTDNRLVKEDMNTCIQTARTPREPTTAERKLLEGNPTSRFFMNGRPVVTPDGKPALHQSAVRPNSSDPYTDLYALCLLSKGYTWRER